VIIIHTEEPYIYL